MSRTTTRRPSAEAREATTLPAELRQPREGVPDNYYGYPTLKKPEWKWQIPLYFFTGGLAAGSYLIATLASLFGTEDDRIVARTGRFIALVSLAVSPILLISDLGRPERFANMLRIVKTRSPMSMGTWGITGFGFFAGLGVLRQLVEDGILSSTSPVARLFAWVPLSVSGVIGSLLAFFVSGYTGVLLSFTNTPFWAKNRWLQAPLFITSALTSAIAAISLVLTLAGRGTGRTYGWLERLADGAAVGEVALMAGSAVALGSTARPLVRPRNGLPFWLAVVLQGTVAPLVLRQLERPHKSTSSVMHVAAHLSVLIGSLAFRWITVEAGQESIDDLRQGGTMAEVALQEVRGTVALVQEDRFRLQMADGRSILFILGAGRGPSLERLESLAGSGDVVLVRYRGDPESGAVAEEIRVES